MNLIQCTLPLSPLLFWWVGEHVPNISSSTHIRKSNHFSITSTHKIMQIINHSRDFRAYYFGHINYIRARHNNCSACVPNKAKYAVRTISILSSISCRALKADKNSEESVQTTKKRGWKKLQGSALRQSTVYYERWTGPATRYIFMVECIYANCVWSQQLSIWLLLIRLNQEIR